MIRKKQKIWIESASRNMETYLPEGACKISSSVMCSVQKEDYLTIYFENASSILTAFKNNLLSSGMEHNISMQHRNNIEVIASAVSIYQYLLFIRYPTYIFCVNFTIHQR